MNKERQSPPPSRPPVLVLYSMCHIDVLLDCIKSLSLSLRPFVGLHPGAPTTWGTRSRPLTLTGTTPREGRMGDFPAPEQRQRQPPRRPTTPPEPRLADRTGANNGKRRGGWAAAAAAGVEVGVRQRRLRVRGCRVWRPLVVEGTRPGTARLSRPRLQKRGTPLITCWTRTLLSAGTNLLPFFLPKKLFFFFLLRCWCVWCRVVSCQLYCCGLGDVRRFLHCKRVPLIFYGRGRGARGGSGGQEGRVDVLPCLTIADRTFDGAGTKHYGAPFFNFCRKLKIKMAQNGCFPSIM